MTSQNQPAKFQLGGYIYEFKVDDKLVTRRSGMFEIVDIVYGGLVLRRIGEKTEGLLVESKRIQTVRYTLIGTAILNPNGEFCLTAWLDRDDLKTANELFLAKLQDERDSYALKAMFWTSLIDAWKEKNECHGE
jgi:hypothetical protein